MAKKPHNFIEMFHLMNARRGVSKVKPHSSNNKKRLVYKTVKKTGGQATASFAKL
jgi:hypothetical protein